MIFPSQFPCLDINTIIKGRWTPEDHELFIQGLKLYNRQWKAISELIQTRTVVQIRTHAQKYFQKLLKCKGDTGLDSDILNHDEFSFKKMVRTLANLLFD